MPKTNSTIRDNRFEFINAIIDQQYKIEDSSSTTHKIAHISSSHQINDLHQHSDKEAFTNIIPLICNLSQMIARLTTLDIGIENRPETLTQSKLSTYVYKWIINRLCEYII